MTHEDFPGEQRRGSKGAAVKRIQEKLRDRGYDLEADGSFGPVTERTVKEFQRRVGLDDDGLVGPLTHYALSHFPKDAGRDDDEPETPADEPDEDEGDGNIFTRLFGR